MTEFLSMVLQPIRIKRQQQTSNDIDLFSLAYFKPGLLARPFLKGWKKIVICTILALLLAAKLFSQNFQRPTIPVVNDFKVNTYTGNLYYQREDLIIPGRLPIDITFSYNSSRRAKDWGLGRGWTFTYNMAYTSDTMGIFIEQMDGKRDLFTKHEGLYFASTGIYDSLIEISAGSFLLKSKEGYKYYFENPDHRKITKLEDNNGNTVRLDYTNNLLSKVIDASGRTCEFKWTNGHLTEIIDHSEPSKPRRISYQYDTTGNQIKVTDQLDHSTIYHYAPDSRLIGMTDKRGYNTAITYYPNATVHEIISCITKHTFSYILPTLQTIVTEVVSEKRQTTKYQFDEQGRIVQEQGGCCGINLSYQYDENNNISSIKDGNNHETKYEYDRLGNVIRETDARGYSTLYTYESLFSNVKTKKDKRGFETIYEYDERGNLRKINWPKNVTEEYTYDTNGDTLSYTDGKGYKTRYDYNKHGYLEKITFPDNSTIEYGYDAWGNQTSIKDARGFTTKFEFDALNRLKKVINPLEETTEYTYDQAGNIKTIKDPLNHITTFEYDGLNRLVKQTSPLRIAIQLEYDERDNVVKITDGNKQATTISYNNRNQVVSVTDALGYTTTYDYDEAGNRTSETDKKGNVTKLMYDAADQLVKVIDALGNAYDLSYDPNGNLVSFTNPNRNTTVYKYDELDRLERMTDALNKYIIYEYDNNDNVTRAIDKNGNSTVLKYDKLNRLDSLIDAEGGLETYTYDGNDNLLTRTNALKFVTRWRYDELDRMISESNPLGDSATFHYDKAGNLHKIIQPNGNTITVLYDEDDRLKEYADTVGLITNYTYDNNGNIKTETNALGFTTTYDYDRENQLIQRIFPNKTTERFDYDKNGNQILEINQKGYATKYDYDALDRLVQMQDALSHVTKFTYDANGNRTGVIDANKNITSYAYDALDRLVRHSLPDGTKRVIGYDANGNATSRVDNKNIVTQFVYDKLNRMTKRVYPDNNTDSLAYDAIGRLRAAINKNASISLEYDDAGRIKSETLNDKIVSYIYNTSGRTREITYPGGTKLRWQMDFRDRLSGISEGGVQQVLLGYDDNDRLIKKDYKANNTTTQYTYDSVSNLKSLQVGPDNRLQINYEYDDLKNRTLTERVHRPDFSEQYSYDSLSQVKSYTTGKYQNGFITNPRHFQYDYDDLGNRLNAFEDTVSHDYVANHLNQYTSVVVNADTVKLVYDDNGNLINDGDNTYTYDHENRLLSIKNSEGEIRYVYDALGRRIAEIVNGQETSFSFLGANLIEERTNGTVKSYVFGEGPDEILYAREGANAYFYHADGLNSIQSITDISGNITEQYHYDPFGHPHIFDKDNLERARSDINSFLFTGRKFNFRSRTYDYRNREMHPRLGRFVHRDPLGFIDGFNIYAYVKNRPGYFYDPYGLWSWSGVLDGVQLGLDVAGLVPGIGEFADLANAGIYLARGDYINAGFSAAAAIPFVGWGATGAKFANKAHDLSTGVKASKAFIAEKSASKSAKKTQSKTASKKKNDADQKRKVCKETKSNTTLGKEEHKEFKKGENEPWKFKELRLPPNDKGKIRIADFVDFAKRIVYELKPNNPKAIKRGVKQLQDEIKTLERSTGEKWKGRVDTY